MTSNNTPITVVIDGVTIISCCRYYDGDNKAIAKGMKYGDQKAIQQAAEQMSRCVPSNAVLIPMPGRTGFATYTFDLAEEISRRTGLPVIDAIHGNARESLYEMKQQGRMLTEDDLGFRQTTSIDKGKIPYIIENVVDTGRTAKAAAHSIKEDAVILSYSISDILMSQNINKELHQGHRYR